MSKTANPQLNTFRILNSRHDEVPIGSITPHPKNVNEGDVGSIHESITENGFYGSIIVQESTRFILVGKHRWLAARQAKAKKVPVTFIDCDDATALRIMLADNRTSRLGHDDENALATLLQEIHETQGSLLGTGFDSDFLDHLLSELSSESMSEDKSGEGSEEQIEQAHQSLAMRFGIPPFTILDARQGYWQGRKNAWLKLGLRSFEGRDEELLLSHSAKPPAYYALRNEMRAESGVDPSWPEIIEEAKARGMSQSASQSGTSIFDPVLCELAYRWFCPPQGVVLDPFAGGSVRGLVAAKLGFSYCGIDLSERQIEANYLNWEQFSSYCDESTPAPIWVQGDSLAEESYRDFLKHSDTPIEFADFILSCPPYYDLEKYSDAPNDLSNMKYADFLEAYRSIIARCAARLKENRFACFVVGDVRDKAGFYRNFVSETISAFEEAGMQLYNEAILVTVAGSLPIRIGTQFGKYRKLGKTHQNVLVFYKGDPKKIPELLGETEFRDLEVSDEGGAGDCSLVSE